MTLDLIIISDAKTPDLLDTTLKCMDSADTYEKKAIITTYIMESSDNIHSYAGCITKHPSADFNYNKYLNLGASLGNSEYIAFCNNDLVFGKNWASKLINAMEDNDLDSVSPYSYASHEKHKTGILPNTGIHKGLTVKRQFEGWCFVWRRSLWNEIKLDERISFWCSDDATVEQLKAAGKSHALVTYAFVEHTNNGGHTLKTMPNRHELTIGQAKKFNQLYDKNIENVGK